MKTKTIKSQTMRTLLIFLLFVSGFAYAQPPINNPTPYAVCDDNNDTYANFDLTTKIPEILGTLNPNDYNVTFYYSLSNAQSNINPIPTPNSFINTVLFIQTIGVRVTDNITSEYSITTLDLVINQQPTANQAPNLIVYENPYDGIAVFDLTSQIGIIGVGAGSTVSFYPTLVNAQIGINEIPNPAAYMNQTNPQTIGVRVTNTVTGCFTITSFNLVVNVSNIVTPTPYAVCDDNNDGVAAFDLHSKDAEIINGNTSLVVSYFLTNTDAITGSNPITWSPYYNMTNPQILYVRVIDPADPGNPSITTLSLVANPTPIVNPAPNMVMIDYSNDGYEVFDLNSQIGYIGVGFGTYITFYTNLFDAQIDSNAIVNPGAYVNLSNPQTIGVRVTDSATGCYSITSFDLIVQQNVYIPDANFKAKLIALGVDTSNDGEIQYTEALIPTSLDISNLSIGNLTGIEAFINLTSLNCENNNITYLQINSSTMQELNCQNNPIQNLSFSGGNLTILNVSNCPNMSSIYCGGNAISTLDLTGKPNLTSVFCELNQITALDVTGSPNLQYLSCRNNLIPVLDLTNNTALTDLNCGVNLMTSLDVSQCVNLINFHCHTLPIYSLDVSNSPNLCNFLCIYNNNLTQLNIKNGSNNCYTQFGIHDNPNLQFVCTDDDETTHFENYFTSLGANVNINSYCNFTPGGDYNTITGQIKLDADNNGCDAGDLPQQFIKVRLCSPIDCGSTFTNLNGNYMFFTNANSFGWSPDIENPSWFSFSPSNGTVLFSDINNNTATQDFCIVPNGNHQDLEIVIEPINPARPGFDATYKIVYKNKGNNMVSGNLTFNYNDSILDFISATVAPSSQNAGVLNWNYTNLLPFESRSFYLTLNVNSPTETPPVSIGTLLSFNATINPIATDENQVDNQFALTQTVIGSYDPNAITCIEGENLATTEIGKYLHYGITFENIGNYYAENVVVKDIIDTTKYDINSIQLLDTSHPVYTRITGNVVEFIFQNINLAATSGNPPVGGHGDILFKIKSLDNLVNGDMVTKSAKIYFDYNAPIDTNIAETTYSNLNNSIFQLDNSVSVAPNPTNSFISITSKFNIKSIELFDVQGRILETSFENNTKSKIDLSGKQNGIYFLKINTENGSKVEKIVKE